ncbi:hypothetical protein [Allosphingosinicella indica]|uniref:Uncharacterized protein n=1 Tax=Allosphingosinicella indica TaxID=941907 RepID=A0A1X7G088_9SPHN|nr:hypothetical protein [Allosphingosinicella indica]SMF61676.1 hypothetical protein SAMN06295910_0668 [Allosphingosinicella indica]
MQRVRIGLTGLAFVFVLVLLAAVFTNPSEEAPITANTIERARTDSEPAEPSPAPAPKEPLAELGVAPGGSETNAIATAPEPEPTITPNPARVNEPVR